MIKDLTGIRFGRLVAIKVVGRNPKTRRVLWECKCDCGNIKTLSSQHLLNNNSFSCGCLFKELHKKGEPRTHGFWSHKLYAVYYGMMSRCSNKNTKQYKDYGGRGITVCQEWAENKQNFFEWALNNGYKEELEIDRIDNNKGYSPDNCRWVTHNENMKNTRRNIHIVLNDKDITLSEIAELYHLDKNKTYRRYKIGKLKQLIESEGIL